MDTFFNRFFDEKNLENRIYEVAAPQGTMNFIETDMVIAKIKTTQGEEAQKIETDFANGNVHHFLNHIAQAMAVDF